MAKPRTRAKNKIVLILECFFQIYKYVIKKETYIICIMSKQKSIKFEKYFVYFSTEWSASR